MRSPRALVSSLFAMSATALLVLAMGTAQGATADSLVGTWDYAPGGQINITQTGSTFAGVVTQAVIFSSVPTAATGEQPCSHEAGENIWRITSSTGQSYGGTTDYFHGGSACHIDPTADATWSVDSGTTDKLTYCAAVPPNPVDAGASPDHPVGDTECFVLTRDSTGSVTPASVPASQVRPSIVDLSGVAPTSLKEDQTVACAPGTWTSSPTKYGYQWSRGGTPIAGATLATYTVRQLDEGLALTCTVTAYEGDTAGASATSAAVPVVFTTTAGCPAATGSLHGTKLGLVALGMTRAAARHAYTKSSSRGKPYQDFFCLTPIGVRVGYPSPTLLSSLSPHQRREYGGRVIWASTSSTFYSLHGVRSGATVAAAAAKIKLGKAYHVDGFTWYLSADGRAEALFKVQHGAVIGIGIGVKSMLTNLSGVRKFLHSVD